MDSDASKGKLADEGAIEESDYSSGDDMVLEEGGDADESIDGPGATRSSVKKVASLISTFDEEKRQLVRSIGFGGLLHLPQNNKVSRTFTVWLLARLDVKCRTIKVDGEPVIDLVDYDVQRILGIPCGPRPVVGLPSEDSKSKKEFMQKVLGAEPNETNSLLVAARIVSKDYGGRMTQEEKDHFKASFVVFIVGHLLAPTTKLNVGPSNFWGALCNACEIGSYNWCEYVVEQLVEAAIKVQSDLKIKQRVSNVTGCAIALQIMYLESLTISGIPKPVVAADEPRVKGYSCLVLWKMMEADQANSSSGSKKRFWGSSLVRSATTTQPDVVSQEELNWSKLGAFGINLRRFVSQSFGGKLNQSQIDAISVYNTRCSAHFDDLKKTIMKENLVLFEFLLTCASNTKSNVTQRSGETNPKPVPVHDKGRAKRSGESIKIGTARGYSSADKGCAIRRRIQKGGSSSYVPAETILSGQTLPRTEQHPLRIVELFKNTSPGIGIVNPEPRAIEETIRTTENVRNIQGIDAPSFDLGIDFQTQLKYMNSVEKNKPQEHVSLVPQSSVSLQEMSNKAGEQNDNLQQTPVPKKNGKNIETWSTPDQTLAGFTTSPGSVSKILASCEITGRILLTEDEVNVNIKPWDHDTTESPVTKQKAGPQRLSKSPWFYGLKHEMCPPALASKILAESKKMTGEQLARAWVVHRNPRFIEVSGNDLLQEFSLQESMSYNLFDLALRRLVQLDKAMYKSCNEKRWHHILHSDFAMFAQAEEKASCKKSIREQFFPPAVNYSIPKCRMIVVPAQVLKSWCCYFWDFKKSCISVIDPSYKKEDCEFYVKKHKPVVDRIGKELANCIAEFFENWEVKWGDWKCDYIVPAIPNASSVESGFLTLLSVVHFDGEGFRNYTQEVYTEFKDVLFAELISMEENEATPPLMNLFEGPKPTCKEIHTIDD